MTLRRFGVLVAGLPASSRTLADENAGWSTSEHLLVLNAEISHAAFRALVALTGNRPPKPLRIPRPGDKPRVMSMRQLARTMTKAR